MSLESDTEKLYSMFITLFNWTVATQIDWNIITIKMSVEADDTGTVVRH